MPIYQHTALIDPGTNGSKWTAPPKSQAMSGVSPTGGAFSMLPPLMAICSCIGTLGCEKRRCFLGGVVTPLKTKMSSKKDVKFKCKAVFEPLVFRGHVLVFGRVPKHFPYKMGIPKNSFGGPKVETNREFTTENQWVKNEISFGAVPIFRAKPSLWVVRYTMVSM